MQGFSLASFLVILMFNALQGEKKKDWHETAVLYQIYTRSFKDSDGDGIGDIKGIHEKLDYIKDTGFDTVWIQTFFKSPNVDFGFDVSDHKSVDPTYGTIEDVRRLVDAIHEKGMRVLFDFIPNHTSDKNDWFIKSVNREDPYTDFYIWRDPKGFDAQNQPIPPNNWLSIFNGPAWRWNEKRRQFYYTLFTAAQPDLNYRNPKVRSAMEDVIQYWLDFGVDGFRVDFPAGIFEDEQLRDNTWVSPELENSTNYHAQVHTYQYSLDEVAGLAQEWRSLLDRNKQKDGKTRLMVLEFFLHPDGLIKFFGDSTDKTSLLPFYFGLMWMDNSWRATDLNRTIHGFMDIIPANGVPSWMASTHDFPRIATRVEPEFSEAASMIQLMLPGLASIYYGQEIGMTDVRIRADQRQEDNGRDGCRGPMQWDESLNSGFTTNKKAWLPVNPEYWRHNVKEQLKDPVSHLNIFKRLLELRQNPVIKNGELETCVVSEWMFLFARKLQGQPPIFIVVNMGSETESMCLNQCAIYKNLPDTLEVHTSSANSGHNFGDRVTVLGSDSKCSSLRPKSGLVLTSTTDNHSSGSKMILTDAVLMIPLTVIMLRITQRDF